MEQSSKTLITAKINPDLDGVACSYAYSHLMRMQGVNATEGIFGILHAEAQYLIDRFNIDDISYDPNGPFDSFILVDASDLKGMPSVIRPEDVVEVIDHREVCTTNELFPNAKFQIEKVGAAATQIAEKYRDSGMIMDDKSAFLLYGAIFSNTLNLQASVTTERDKKVIEWLKGTKPIPPDLIQNMFLAKTAFADKYCTQTIQNDFKEFFLKDKKIGILQLEALHVEKLIQNHFSEIIDLISALQEKHHLDFILLNSIDLSENFNLFITNNPATQLLMDKIFQIHFKNSIAKKKGLILRKELVPLIMRNI